MSKFICYHQNDSNSNPKKIAECSTKEEAARYCDDYIHGDRNHECIKSLMERDFYLIGYGPSSMFIEEK